MTGTNQRGLGLAARTAGRRRREGRLLAHPGLGHRMLPFSSPVRSAGPSDARTGRALGRAPRGSVARPPGVRRDASAAVEAGRVLQRLVRSPLGRPRPATPGVFAVLVARRPAVRRQRHDRARAPSCAPTGATPPLRPRRAGAVRRPGSPSSTALRKRGRRAHQGRAPGATPWCGRCAPRRARSRRVPGWPPVAGRASRSPSTTRRAGAYPARTCQARRPRRPPAGRAGRRQRALARRRRGDDAPGPAGHLDERGPLRRQHPDPAGPRLLPALPDHRDRRPRRDASRDRRRRPPSRSTSEFAARRSGSAGRSRSRARSPSRRTPARSTCSTRRPARDAVPRHPPVVVRAPGRRRGPCVGRVLAAALRLTRVRPCRTDALADPRGGDPAMTTRILVVDNYDSFV